MRKAQARLSENEPARPGIFSEGLFRAVVESWPSAVILGDADGKIVAANHLLGRLFGYADGELIGQSADVLLPEATRTAREACITAFRTAAEGQRAAGIRDLEGRRRDDSRLPIEIDLHPIATEHGTFVLASIVDVAARTEIEEAHRRWVKDQLEFERLAAELSVQFINLPVDQVDDAIRAALARIGEIFDLDRCTFVEVEPNGQIRSPLAWTKEGIPTLPGHIDARQRFPWAFEKALAGELVCFCSTDEIPEPVDRANYRTLGTRSTVAVPLSVERHFVGAVAFDMVARERSWLPEEIHRLRVFATAFGNVLARRQSEQALQTTLAEIERLRDQLHAENLYLRREAEERIGNSNIVGQSAAIRRVLDQVEQVAATDSTVLLLGETGTGKEVFATRIHELSHRRGRPMVRVNCSAIPATLMESELFGREKGAFTGALARQIGRFELADQSTIFLDEIGDLPPDIQVKLLRVLEEKQFERLGSPKALHVDARVIAATHRDLDQQIAKETFREDLFYRLNVFPIRVPPLRERVEDIPLLVWRFVEQFSKAFGKPIEAITRENMTALQQYSWPGNIRELRNVVERAMIVATGTRLTVPVPAPSAAAAARSSRLADVEKDHIRKVLESTGWRVRGMGGAADRLGLRPTTLETRMAKLGISRAKLALGR